MTQTFMFGPTRSAMLNPSTADGTDDDPTLTRCTRFSQSFGAGSLTVVNLYAWRATKPDDVPSDGTEIGPDADEHIRAALDEADRVICAWGSTFPGHRRAKRVAEILRMIDASGLRSEALAFTADGTPRHPLYLRGDLEPVVWESTW